MVGSYRRGTSACAIALLCLALCGSLPVLAVDTGTGFAGTIKDSVGHVLDGVEILIVQGASAADSIAQVSPVTPIAKVSSDVWGRFAIPDLAPGAYGFAALKQGYRTHIGNVDTRIERVIDVVLFPMPARSSLQQGTVAEDPAWLLRLPRRTVFRETEAGVDSAPQEAGTRVPSSEVPIQMRVDQLFAVGAPFPSHRGEPVKLQGNETRVRLATSLGERGNLRLDGRRESLGSTLKTDAGDTASSESSGVNVDFSYDTSPDSRLSMKAFFNAQDLAWNTAEALPLVSRRKSWGYESEWQKQLGDQSSLRVAVDYNDDSLHLPFPEAASGEAGILAGPGVRDRSLGSLTRRTVVAGGAYESLAADRHQLQVAFKARLFDSPTASTGAHGAMGALLSGRRGDPGRGQDGWSLRLNAQDSWAMTGPFTLLYGLDYQHALTDRDTAVVVPSMGGAWAIDRVALRFSLSYHAVAQWDEAPAGSKQDLRRASLLGPSDRGARDDVLPARDVGYQAEVELPVTGTLRLKGASSFVPIQLEGIGRPLLHVADFADLPGSGSFLGDGAAAVGETSLSLVHDLGDARTWFELSRGQAQGMLAMGSDRQGVLPTLTLGELTYDNGSWGFQMIPSGTDLRVLYKRVVESQGRDHEARPVSERETVELQLIQSLMRFHGLGNWRLLMAVRMAMQDFEDEDRWANGTDPAVLRAFNEGVSAGLSVTF